MVLRVLCGQNASHSIVLSLYTSFCLFCDAKRSGSRGRLAIFQTFTVTFSSVLGSGGWRMSRGTDGYPDHPSRIAPLNIAIRSA